MKKFSILFLSFIAIAATLSCSEDDEELIISQPNSQLSFKSTAATSYVLTFDTKDNLAERLVWNTVEFDTPISVNYAVQASTDATNFDNAVVVTTTNNDFVDLSVERLNDLAAELGLTPFTQGNIAVRVVGTTADASMEAMISDVLVLPVTSYTTESPKLWVPGNYAAASGYGADWSPGDLDTPFIQAIEFGSVKFEGFIYMDVASPEFKFTPEQDWDEAYGDAGSGMISLSSGGNLTVPGAGYYYITVDLDPNDDGDFSDATWSATSKSWAVIGAATPNAWNDPDTNMTYNPATKKWEVTVALTQDDFKFRANDDWGNANNNFGADPDNAGFLKFNAGNLTFTDSPGMYKVELDLSNPRAYTYTTTSI